MGNQNQNQDDSSDAGETLLLEVRTWTGHLGVSWDGSLEVFELLALLSLDLQGDLAAAVEEFADLPEILLCAAPRGHGRGPHADTSRRQSRGVAVHCVAVQGDGGRLADLLNFGAGEAVGPQVPKQEVIVRAIARQLVALSHKGLCQRLGVRLHLASIVFEHWCVHLQQLRGQGTDLVVVGTTLKGWEHGHVDALLDVRDLLGVLEEDHASPWSAQRLVGGGGHDVAVLEGRRMLAGGDQPGDVGDVCQAQGSGKRTQSRHVICGLTDALQKPLLTNWPTCHQDRSNFVCDFTELSKVDDARVRGGSAEDHGRSEDESCLAKLIEVDKSGFWVHTVRQRLEVDGGRLSIPFFQTIQLTAYPLCTV